MTTRRILLRSGDPIGRAPAARAHHGQPRGRPAAAAHARGGDRSRRAIRRRGARPHDRRLRRAGAAQPAGGRSPVARGRRPRAGRRRRHDARRGTAAARPARGIRQAVRVHARARYFSQMGFSIVPHLWVPEKIFTDCVKCPSFRRCGQFAMVVPLEPAAETSSGRRRSRCGSHDHAHPRGARDDLRRRHDAPGRSAPPASAPASRRVKARSTWRCSCPTGRRRRRRCSRPTGRRRRR